MLFADSDRQCTHNAFYDYLKEKEFTATMFYIGSNVLNWPLQAQRGLADLHEIGIHTCVTSRTSSIDEATGMLTGFLPTRRWSHRYSTALTNEQMFAELWYTRKAIKAVTGITPTTWWVPQVDSAALEVSDIGSCASLKACTLRRRGRSRTSHSPWSRPDNGSLGSRTSAGHLLLAISCSLNVKMTSVL